MLYMTSKSNDNENIKKTVECIFIHISFLEMYKQMMDAGQLPMQLLALAHMSLYIAQEWQKHVEHICPMMTNQYYLF